MNSHFVRLALYRRSPLFSCTEDILRIAETAMPTENREFSRIENIDLQVEVRGAEGVMIEGSVKDISVKSVSVIADRLLPMGKECHVVLLFENETQEWVRLTLAGIVSRAEGNLMAVTFTELDQEKMDVLRTQVLKEPYAHESRPGQKPTQYSSR
jgi:hypothetical protein